MREYGRSTDHLQAFQLTICWYEVALNQDIRENDGYEAENKVRSRSADDDDGHQDAQGAVDQ